MLCLLFSLGLLKVAFFKFQALQAQTIKYTILESVYDYWKEKVCSQAISCEGYVAFVHQLNLWMAL